MNVEMVRMGMFMTFLLTAAWQDFRTKQVTVGTFLLAGASALVLQSLGVLLLASATGSEERDLGLKLLLENWNPYLAGILPGAALLVLSRVGCGIGAGDGCFFLVSGLFLGFRHNLVLLCGTVFGCGLFALCFYAAGYVRGNHRRGKTELPFLPFALIPGLWITSTQLLPLITQRNS